MNAVQEKKAKDSSKCLLRKNKNVINSLQEINSLTAVLDVLKCSDQDTLVIFDIDDVLIMPIKEVVLTSSTTEPTMFINIGKYLKKTLLQSTLSIVMYPDNAKVSIDNAKLSRGFQAIATGYSIKQLAHEWQHQAEQHMTATMYVTAGFYTKIDDNIVFIQGEANPEKPHLNSVEKIKEWEKMTILVANATAKNLKINNINLMFKDVYFTYLNS